MRHKVTVVRALKSVMFLAIWMQFKVRRAGGTVAGRVGIQLLRRGRAWGFALGIPVRRTGPGASVASQVMWLLRGNPLESLRVRSELGKAHGKLRGSCLVPYLIASDRTSAGPDVLVRTSTRLT